MHTFETIAMQDNSKYLKIWKPLIDRLMAVMLLVVLLPLILVLSAMLILTGQPILFKHLRPGYKGQIFQLYKFTSMKNGVITRLGRLLRKSSLDELPQLVNIIKGEMSFVGPRPLLTEYLDHYSDIDKIRHDVKPGITGLAQVNGRNMLSLEEKVHLDLIYVDQVSFLLDLKIIFKTAIRIFNFRQADYHTLELHKHS